MLKYEVGEIITTYPKLSSKHQYYVVLKKNIITYNVISLSTGANFHISVQDIESTTNLVTDIFKENFKAHA